MFFLYIVRVHEIHVSKFTSVHSNQESSLETQLQSISDPVRVSHTTVSSPTVSHRHKIDVTVLHVLIGQFFQMFISFL